MGLFDDLVETPAQPTQQGLFTDLTSKDQVNTPEHQEARRLLGMPAIMKPGSGQQMAEQNRPMDIGKGPAFVHGLMMPFGHTPPPEVYAQHPHMADLGGVTSILGQSLPIGGPLRAATALGKAGLGAAGGAAYTGLPQYLKGMIQGKTQKQAISDAFTPTVEGAALGSVGPYFIQGAGKVLSTFKTLAYNTPIIEHLVHQAFDKFQSETNIAADKAMQAWKEVSGGLNPESLKRVVTHLETPGSVSNLTQAEQQAANKYTTLLKPVQDMIKKEGLTNVFHDNYVKHLYENKTDELYDYMKSMPGAKERSFTTYEDAIKFNKEKIKEVQDRGFDPELVKKMTPAELKANQLDLRMPRWLGLKPIQDPGLSLAATVKSAYQTLNVKNFVHTLSSLKDEQGRDLMVKASEDVGKNYKTIDDPRGLLKKYMFSGSKDTGDGRMTFLREGNVAVLKQYAPMLEKIISSNSPSQIQQGLKEFNRVTKSLTFYNPAWHMVNLFSSALRVMPGNVYRALGLGSKHLLNDNAMMQEMIRSGVQAERVVEAKNAMYQALRSTTGANQIPILSQLSNTLNNFQHKTLWAYASGLQANIWNAHRANFLKKGFDEATAGRMAAEVTNDAMGLVAKNRIPELLKNPMFGKYIAFIPQWITTKSRELMGTVAPGMVFKSFNKEQQQALQKQYIFNTMYGAAQWMTTAALANKALSGHWPWENAPGHRSPEKIETRWGYTVDNPFFKGITLPYRLAQSMEQLSPRFAHPVLKATYGQATGKDILTNKPFLGPGMSLDQQVGARGKQVLKDLNLFGTGDIVRESEKLQPNYAKSIAQMLAPVYISKDNPAGPVAAKLMQMKKLDNPYHDVQYTPPWKMDLDRALLKKDYSTVKQIATENGKNLDWIRKEQMKVTKPVTYLLNFYFNSKDRRKYVNQLSAEEQTKLFDQMKKEEEK